MDILKTNNLCKMYNKTYALKNLNMNIEEGDIYGFVGENGAGKTTVIRLITGLANPTSGTFELFGVKNTSNKFDDARKNISAIVEAPSINKSFTALENLKCQNILTNSNKSDEELINIINLVGLNYESIKTKKAKNFSLGMRQRLGIAIVLVSSPKFIILDEPMNGLDPQGIIEMRETIVNLNQKGVTFLISSHILAELEKICTRVGFISHGKLLEEISMDELRAKARRKLIISCKNVKEIKENLTEELKLKDVETIENRIVIYDKVDINKVMSYLVKNDIKVQDFSAVEENIEDYYMSLMVKGAKENA